MWEKVKFEECLKYKLSFRKRHKTCGMLFNEKWVCKTEVIVLREMSVAGEQEVEAWDWPWMWPTSTGSMETSSAAQEKASACHFLVFPNHVEIAVSLKPGKPQGRTAVSHSVALWATFRCPLFLVQRTGLLWTACGLLAAWGSTREAITPCWSLRGTVTKWETTWAKLGTYSLKLC